jgi:hypothetical protein
MRRIAVVACLGGLALWAALVAARSPGQNAATFASEIARLSEPEGSFDTDNLISNERQYLRVIPALVSRGISGGTYLGVGPDQNFSYIARIRPTLAYIVDVRRDNLLLHLLFKALFSVSQTRVEYISHLTGRAPPADSDTWTKKPIEELVAWADTHEASAVDTLRRRLDNVIAGFGVATSSDDRDTIDRFHRTFIRQGLNLRFNTFGRPPQPYYPSLRDLLLATDGDAHPWNFLASEDDFRFVKDLQARDAIIPVVGDISGTQAMGRIAETIAARGSRVSAFYLSNVETYLYRNGQWEQFLDNIARLPRDDRSVAIRSIFSGAGMSTSVVEPLVVSR